MKKLVATIAMLGAGVFAGSVVGSAPADAATKKAAKLTTSINVVLTSPNDQAFTDYAYQTVTPGAANYHQYLTPNQVAAQFGQSKKNVNRFKAYFKKHHLTTTVYPGNLVLRVTGTHANLVKAFSAKLVKAKTNQRTRVRLPKQLSNKTVAVIGLYATKKDGQKAKAKRSDTDYPKFTQKPNLNLDTTAFAKQYGAAKFTSQYQLDSVTGAGNTGAGQRIGIITTNTDINVGDVQTYWRKVGVNAAASRITKYYTGDSKAAVGRYNKLTGLTGNQIEASLDVQQSGEVAPDAHIDVYNAVSSDATEEVDQQHYNAFTQAISSNRDQQLSTSFSPGIENPKLFSTGTSESIQQYNAAFNQIFRQAAAQGISVFTASGDNGVWASPAKTQNHLFSTSPYVTIVGGTTLPFQATVRGQQQSNPAETAWADISSMSAKDVANGKFNASGGGFSALNPTPPYQLGVPGVNTFRAINMLTYSKGKFTVQKNPQVSTGTTSGRNFPDVAGNADVRTGYAVYYSGKQMTVKGGKLVGKMTKTWSVDGGTSFTTPQMAGANAVMNSAMSHRIGMWNPQIYQFAQQLDSPFNVLDDPTSTNLYYTGQPGKLYNQATGLGTINFTKLFAKFNAQ
ncbi:protease pro-enzyme activation domain-containing protein [uncultured Secundilactobacillus sp.]|uniref:S53 family peptidase n=1 Tax=uncultured Secundilactobacillus sp. TaxID=2813935 RepID=UPI0025873B1F|nr:S53 family peptidase [uncultured Secundilactobacillus sp.]